MDIKKIIIVVIIAFFVGYFVWSQCQIPLDFSSLSVTKPVTQQPSPEQELNAINVGSLDADFEAIDADLKTL